MNELKSFKLNNSALEDFDKLMSYHLDQVEELVIDEISLNSKLYNIISLCINVKTLKISGDMRVDVNKIMFNICKPDKVETLILNNVKLPTTKAFEKYTSLSILSLNNIKFSDLQTFFNKIPNKEKVIALNLTNVDFGKKSITMCKIFENLKYLNIDGLINCKFDDFSFLYENEKLERFEFYNNEIKFEDIKYLSSGRFIKNIEVNVETSSNNSEIYNSFSINRENEISITVNTFDLGKCVENVSLYRVSNLYIIMENSIEINQYIKRLRKIKENVILAIKDIAYLNVEQINEMRDKLNVESITIFEDSQNIKNCTCYFVNDYIEIRKAAEEIVSNIPESLNDLEKFNNLYNYFKEKIEYDEEAKNIQDVFIRGKASYNLYASAISSCLKIMNFENKVIGGEINNERNLLWNQVKIDGQWYNFDIAGNVKAKQDKKFMQYVFKENLLNDEQFYKNHTPTFGEPEHCTFQIQEAKKELKNSFKKISFIGRLYSKLKSIFRFNRQKALPSFGNEEDNTK
jgi:hypothetical protein